MFFLDTLVPECIELLKVEIQLFVLDFSQANIKSILILYLVFIFRTQPQGTACQAMKDNRCCWTRGKVIGGSSVLNTMLYIRGNRRDYDQWASLGNPGWSYEEILPYFRKSEDQRNPYLAKNSRYHGTGA